MKGIITLGLDIGSNSVGSASIDLASGDIRVGVTVFPAGVDQTEEARGAPKNQDRRAKRSLRRSLARRSARKRAVRRVLTAHALLPTEPAELVALFSQDPWQLRCRALSDALTPHEFGRAVLHLAQRRGAMGLKLPDAVSGNENGDDESKKRGAADDESAENQRVKGAVDHTRREIEARGARTFGELMAMVSEERRLPIMDQDGRQKRSSDGKALTYGQPIRNRLDSFEFHADRGMIRDEFCLIWDKQCSIEGSPLAQLLTDDLREALDNPQPEGIWRHRGAVFGQRRTYWDSGTLGRCVLEPSDRCVSIADRHASYFRVLETVNNLRLRGPGDREFRPLNPTEHAKVLAKLRSQKSGSIPAIRQALNIETRSLKKRNIPESAYKLNVAGDDDRELNGDWFHASIVRSIGESTWNAWDENRREGLNRAILKFDPQLAEDEPRLAALGNKLGLDNETVEKLIAAWRTRPKLERRMKLSRRAVRNCLPYMEQPTPDGRWRTQIEARQAFAVDPLATDAESGRPATESQRQRYRIGALKLTKSERHFLRKHPDLLPPAPTLSNPVVRKAIHEVRRHVIEHIRARGCKPDRIVIEFAREAVKSKKISDRIFFRNQRREKIRKQIIEEVLKPAFGDRFHLLSHNQLRAAIERVILCNQQKGACAYSRPGETITPFAAAIGEGLEVDHIIPYSRCGDNSLNNRVLCFRKANRDKGRQTPREWWGASFDEKSAPIRWMDGHEPSRGEYFERRDYAAKWSNFSRADVPLDWKGSQLSDTAYAAREVQAYLQQALWPDEPSHLEGGERRIFVTKGRYTAILRKDWQLYEQVVRGNEVSPNDMLHAQLKNRGDHREHALDAVAIALTDGERIGTLAQHAKLEEEERVIAAAQGREPRRITRTPIAPPWGDVAAFRNQVISLVYGGDGKGRGLIVSHRPTKRRITGFLHKQTLYGAVIDQTGQLVSGRVTIRQRVYESPQSHIKPSHLRLPVPETRPESIRRITHELKLQGLKPRAAKQRAIAIIESQDFTPLLIDPPPGKSGIVRDLDLRRTVRRCLEERGINPDDFSGKELKASLDSRGPLAHPSGVPIKSAVLLWSNSDPVAIRRRRWNPNSGRMEPDEDVRSTRFYDSQSNHHIEIRENEKGEWIGEIVRTYDAALRVRRDNLTAVDRSDDSARGGRFIMSLSEGETVHMRHKDTAEEGYFVVFKLDKPQTIQFKWHWDARRATGEKDENGQLIQGSEREPIPVTASQLKVLAPADDVVPYKVRVNTLGVVQRLYD